MLKHSQKLRISFSIILSCLFISTLQAKPNKKKLPIVRVEKFSKKNLFEKVKLPGIVKATEQSKVISQYEGVVKEITVNIGQEVKSGQTLILVKNTDPVYEYRSMKINSPIDGVITELKATIGKYLGKGDQLLTIVNPKGLYFTVEVPQEDLKYVKANLPCSMRFTSTSKEQKCVIKAVSPFIDPYTGTSSAIVEFENVKNQKIYPGMMGDILFKINERKGYRIPETALTYEGKKVFIDSVVDNKIKKIEVKVLSKLNALAEISGKFENVKEYVAKRNSYLKDGAEIEVEKKESH